MSVFWNAIHTVRAGAYFKNALDQNSNQKARDQYKKSHKISEKLLLSGVILATSALLLGRACWRAIKRHHKKRKVKKAMQATQPTATSTIVPPSNNYHYEPDTYEDRIKQSNDILKNASQSKNNTDDAFNVWGSDIPLTTKQWKALRNLKLYKVQDDKNLIGTCCLEPISKHGSVLNTIYVNGSGIWMRPDPKELEKDKNKKPTKEELLNTRYQLLDNSEQNKIIKLTRLSQMMDSLKADENYLPDLFTICDIINFIQ